jgi:hypothetical protein
MRFFPRKHDAATILESARESPEREEIWIK